MKKLAWLVGPLDLIAPRVRKRLFWYLMAAAVPFFAAIAFGFGPILTSDGRFLHGLALRLLELNLDPVAFVTENSESPRLTGAEVYLLYFYQLAAFEALMGDRWIELHVLLNVLAQTATLGLTVVFAARALQTGFAVAFVLLTSLICWEFLQWIPRTQSDTQFVLFTTGQLLLVYFGWTVPDRGKALRYLVAALIVGLLALFLRPTGPGLVGIGLFALVAGLSVRNLQPAERCSLIRRWLGVLLIGLVGIFFVGTLFLFDPALVPNDGFSKVFSVLHESAAQGAVVNERPETFRSPPETYFEYVGLTAVRLVYFFWFVAEGFSAAHNLINIVFFVPLYGLVAVGVWLAFRLRVPLSPGARLGAFASIAAIAVFDVMHATSLIDFDWRYRAPVYPALFFLSTIGAVTIGQSLRAKFRWDSAKA